MHFKEKSDHSGNTFGFQASIKRARCLKAFRMYLVLVNYLIFHWKNIRCKKQLPHNGCPRKPEFLQTLPPYPWSGIESVPLVVRFATPQPEIVYEWRHITFWPPFHFSLYLSQMSPTYFKVFWIEFFCKRIPAATKPLRHGRPQTFFQGRAKFSRRGKNILFA